MSGTDSVISFIFADDFIRLSDEINDEEVALSDERFRRLDCCCCCCGCFVGDVVTAGIWFTIFSSSNLFNASVLLFLLLLLLLLVLFVRDCNIRARSDMHELLLFLDVLIDLLLLNEICLVSCNCLLPLNSESVCSLFPVCLALLGKMRLLADFFLSCRQFIGDDDTKPFEFTVA